MEDLSFPSRRKISQTHRNYLHKKIQARNGHNVRIYARNIDTVTSINENHWNDRFLTSLYLPESLVVVNSLLEPWR